jgi:hypothetical protein
MNSLTLLSQLPDLPKEKLIALAELSHRGVDIRPILAKLQKEREEAFAQLRLNRPDPVELARKVGITPDPWQADLLRASEKEIVLNCSRQSGKSTTTSLIALYELLYGYNVLVLILSPTQRQSDELFLKINSFYQKLAGEIRLSATVSVIPADSNYTEGWQATKQTGREIILANGNRVVALPSKEANIRGFSGVTLLIEDEASRVPDILYQAARPMLAVSGGRFMLLSTPWGKRGHFYEVWDSGDTDWRQFEVKATQCPRIPAKFLANERRNLPPLVFNQEYMCEFAATEGALFTYEEIDGAVVEDMPALFEDELTPEYATE